MGGWGATWTSRIDTGSTEGEGGSVQRRGQAIEEWAQYTRGQLATPETPKA